jgi:hypothetical protein
MVARGAVIEGSTWKRVIGWSLVALTIGWVAAAMPASAEPKRNLNRGLVIDVPGADAVLYEVTEKMYLIDGDGNVVGPDLATTRKADASLFGWARLGNPLCPNAALETVPQLGVCSVTADGIDNISLWTGLGSVDGTFAVVIQDDNKTDAPEYVVMNGRFAGKMDLSIRPLGKIVGTFTSTGSNNPVPFCGTFRLPFQITADGKRDNPRRGVEAYYLADDGQTLITVQAPEKSIGMPTVRLELKFAGSCS